MRAPEEQFVSITKVEKDAAVAFARDRQQVIEGLDTADRERDLITFDETPARNYVLRGPGQQVRATLFPTRCLVTVRFPRPTVEDRFSCRQSPDAVR